MSESRIQNHEIWPDQWSKFRIQSYKLGRRACSGSWSRRLIWPSSMIHDSRFWIFLVQRPPRAESWAVLKTAVGPGQISKSCLRIQQALQTSTYRTRLALNRRSTQNHDVTFHIVTPPVRIQSKRFSLPILGLWLTNGAESEATRIWEFGVQNQLRCDSGLCN